MCYNDDIFRNALEDGLKEHGFYYKSDVDNIYSIAHKNKPDQITTVRLIGSEPIIEKVHGSKNNTEIKAIGYFRFNLSQGIDPNFYIFAFINNPDKKVEFVIVPCNELKNRITSRKCITYNDQGTEMRFWLLPDSYIFETTNIGAESDWWFVGGRMAIGTQKDFTQFLNQWHVLEKCLKIND